jgi:hypothetical protein
VTEAYGLKIASLFGNYQSCNYRQRKHKTTLVTILNKAYLLNPDLISNSNGYLIKTQLTFPKKWGLGTSSSLINNIAQWLQVDAFKLLKTSFGGQWL